MTTGLRPYPKAVGQAFEPVTDSRRAGRKPVPQGNEFCLWLLGGFLNFRRVTAKFVVDGHELVIGDAIAARG